MLAEATDTATWRCATPDGDVCPHIFACSPMIGVLLFDQSSHKSGVFPVERRLRQVGGDAAVILGWSTRLPHEWAVMEGRLPCPPQEKRRVLTSSDCLGCGVFGGASGWTRAHGREVGATSSCAVWRMLPRLGIWTPGGRARDGGGRAPSGVLGGRVGTLGNRVDTIPGSVMPGRLDGCARSFRLRTVHHNQSMCVGRQRLGSMRRTRVLCAGASECCGVFTSTTRVS